jgi:hypothetical protein
MTGLGGGDERCQDQMIERPIELEGSIDDGVPGHWTVGFCVEDLEEKQVPHPPGKGGGFGMTRCFFGRRLTAMQALGSYSSGAAQVLLSGPTQVLDS